MQPPTKRQRVWPKRQRVQPPTTKQRMRPKTTGLRPRAENIVVRLPLVVRRNCRLPRGQCTRPFQSTPVVRARWDERADQLVIVGRDGRCPCCAGPIVFGRMRCPVVGGYTRCLFGQTRCLFVGGCTRCLFGQTRYLVVGGRASSVFGRAGYLLVVCGRASGKFFGGRNDDLFHFCHARSAFLAFGRPLCLLFCSRARDPFVFVGVVGPESNQLID